MACKAEAAPTKPTFSSLPLATLSALRCLAFPRFSPLRPSLAALTPSWVSFSSSVHLGGARARASLRAAFEACHSQTVVLHRSINLVSAGVGGQNRVKNKRVAKPMGSEARARLALRSRTPIGPLARGALARIGSFSQLAELLR